MWVEPRVFGERGWCSFVPGKVEEKLPTSQAGILRCEVCKSVAFTAYLKLIQLNLLRLEERRSDVLLGILQVPSKVPNRPAEGAAEEQGKMSHTEKWKRQPQKQRRFTAALC